jgi:hypothetical protein
MGNNAWRVIAAGTQMILKLINGMGNAANQIVTAGATAIIKFIEGLGKNALLVVNAGTQAVLKFIEGLGKATVELAKGVGQIIVDFLRELRGAVETYTPQIQEQGRLLAGAMIDGFTGGMAGKAVGALGKVGGFFGSVVQKAKDTVGAKSPATEFIKIGEDVVAGFVLALDNDTSAEASAVGFVGRVTDTFTNALTTVSESLGDMTEFNPVITPVLDLTQVAADASLISGYISPGSGIALTSANLIAAGTNAAKSPDSTTATDMPTGGVKFEQNIYAPEQLSTADIYKQTRNQITMAKEELSIP